MISAALDRGDDGLSTCKAEDLPGPARAALDPRQKLGAADVVVIPRATVGLVKSASFNNVITVRAGAETFKLNTGLFRLWKTPRQFAELGWVLNQEVVPTAAPVHDMRAPGAPPPKPPLHPAVRVLLIVLSFAALAGVVALKMWAR
jgi:hypothetical protein